MRPTKWLRGKVMVVEEEEEDNSLARIVRASRRDGDVSSVELGFALFFRVHPPLTVCTAEAIKAVMDGESFCRFKLVKPEQHCLEVPGPRERVPPDPRDVQVWSGVPSQHRDCLQLRLQGRDTNPIISRVSMLGRPICSEYPAVVESTAQLSGRSPLNKRVYLVVSGFPVTVIGCLSLSVLALDEDLMDEENRSCSNLATDCRYLTEDLMSEENRSCSNLATDCRYLLRR
ncbi:unnamed protein product [Timema podura]|uniref:Uncharacterized protein n=1 Tax=Timema podura TaxID=61482 RepID=A0ABN7P6W5_TIMPD|nr:unnamed protein product [Timema podura]